MIPRINLFSQTAKVNYYSNTVKLKFIPKNINYKLNLEGSSKYRYLLISLNNTSTNYSKKISFNANSNKSFKKEIILYGGAGNYILTLYGKNNSLLTRYTGLLKLKFRAKGKLPNSIKKYVDIEYYTEAGNFRFDKILKKTDYVLQLQGYSAKFKQLQLNISKEGSSLKKETVILLKKNTKFSAAYLLKLGTGKYNIVVFGSKKVNASRLTGLAKFSILSTKAIPQSKKNIPLNKKILEYVKSKLGSKVGRGECWDLAQEALDKYGADWSRPVNFGKLLNPETDKIIPGDIIQFRSVQIVSKKGRRTTTTTIGSPDHTSIVVKVLGKKKYRLAEQNVYNTKIVMINTLDLNNISSGRFWIYRPVKAFLNKD